MLAAEAALARAPGGRPTVAAAARAGGNRGSTLPAGIGAGFSPAGPLRAGSLSSPRVRSRFGDSPACMHGALVLNRGRPGVTQRRSGQVAAAVLRPLKRAWGAGQVLGLPLDSAPCSACEGGKPGSWARLPRACRAAALEAVLHAQPLPSGAPMRAGPLRAGAGAAAQPAHPGRAAAARDGGGGGRAQRRGAARAGPRRRARRAGARGGQRRRAARPGCRRRAAGRAAPGAHGHRG